MLALGLVEQKAVTWEGHSVHAEVVGSSAAGVFVDPVTVNVVGDSSPSGPEVPLDRGFRVGEDTIQKRKARNQGVQVRRHVPAEHDQVGVAIAAADIAQ